MTTAVPYLIWGKIYHGDGSTVWSGLTVQLIDQTDNQGTAEDTSKSNGYYQIEMSQYATDGDTIQVSAAYGNHTVSETFVLDISTGPKQQDLTLGLSQSISELVGMIDTKIITSIKVVTEIFSALSARRL